MTVDPARIGEPAEPPDVPFEGLRRNARALVGGLILLVAIGFLLPDLSPPSTQPPPIGRQRGRIVEVLPDQGDVAAPGVRLLVLEGARKGETIDGHIPVASGQGPPPRYEVGDEVVIDASLAPDPRSIVVLDLYRIPALALLLGLFAVMVTVIGGWRGVRSLIALALTLGVLVKIVVPLILAGWEPGPVAIVAATSVTIVTLLLTVGLRAQTAAAAIGTFISLIVVAVLAAAFDELARFTTLRAPGEVLSLPVIGLPDIDVGGLILAAIIFGALGILGDVTITQAGVVATLHEGAPSLGRVQLTGRAMSVGRSHMVATVHSLVLAYAGASLPLIVLFAAGRQDPLLTASLEVVALEVVRAIVGSIGIVAAVPLTTAVAVVLTDRSLPFFRGSETEARRSHGWH